MLPQRIARPQIPACSVAVARHHQMLQGSLLVVREHPRLWSKGPRPWSQVSNSWPGGPNSKLCHVSPFFTCQLTMQSPEINRSPDGGPYSFLPTNLISLFWPLCAQIHKNKDNTSSSPSRPKTKMTWWQIIFLIGSEGMYFCIQKATLSEPFACHVV